MRLCEHCGAEVAGGEGEWAEHLADEHPKAWRQWYHNAWAEQAAWRNR